MERDTKTLSIQRHVGGRLKVISIATGHGYSELIDQALNEYIAAQKPEVQAAVNALSNLPPETFAAKSGWGATKDTPPEPKKEF